jgi:hypothetical protein
MDGRSRLRAKRKEGRFVSALAFPSKGDRNPDDVERMLPRSIRLLTPLNSTRSSLRSMSTATAIPSERPVQPSSSETPSSTSSSSSSSTPDSGSGSGSSTPPRRLCMQIVIRRDLLEVSQLSSFPSSFLPFLLSPACFLAPPSTHLPSANPNGV